MSDLNYPDFNALNAYVHNEKKGFILVAHQNCKDYAGMVLAIIIRIDNRAAQSAGNEAKYLLDLEWMSLGLDFYGDTLQKSYSYKFESLEKLLEYLLVKYTIKVTDIPVKYSFDSSKHPDPIKDKAKKPAFEAAWKQFQQDFKSGAFLDPSLKLVATHDT